MVAVAGDGNASGPTALVGGRREDGRACEPRATEGAQGATRHHHIARAAIPRKAGIRVFCECEGDVGRCAGCEGRDVRADDNTGGSGVNQITGIAGHRARQDAAGIAIGILEDGAVERQGIEGNGNAIGVCLAIEDGGAKNQCIGTRP